MTDIAEIMARAIYYGKPRNKPYDLLGQHAGQYEKMAQAALAAVDAAGFVVVPKSALDWLYGEGPDADGHWFGDDIQHPRGSFWWRGKFRKLVAASQVKP